MTIRLHAIRAAVVAGTIATTPASADPTFEIGGGLGVHAFSATNELGVPDAMNAPSERNSSLFGIRLGVIFRDRFGIEGEAAVLPTISRVQSFDVVNLSYRIHAIAQYPKLGRIVPFGVAGIGAFHVASSDAPDTIGTDTDAAFYLGTGAKYRLPRDWGVRLDARLLFPPSSVDDGLTTDFELVLSLYKELGRKKIDPDPDRDGILGTHDKCPLEPEDKDAFEDDDGCPDPDNDKDQIADATNKCKNEPEDRDGFEDEDGCPDLDNDKDQIADATDKCKNEPEDKDGFEDEDGCPDPDNDKDQVADAMDKCPDRAETINGFEDDDGCPDVVPTVVAQFTGVIDGITFELSSAKIVPSSYAKLDAAAKVLVDYPTLRIEIHGHTDDLAVVPGSAYPDNLALSQARAEAVKEYIVKRGIAPDRLVARGFGATTPQMPMTKPDGTGRRGADREAARAKNRRVEFHPIVSGTPSPAPPAPTP